MIIVAARHPAFAYMYNTIHVHHKNESLAVKHACVSRYIYVALHTENTV